MKQWTDKELDTLGAAGELEISSRRADGTLSPPVTIWAKRRGAGRISSTHHTLGPSGSPDSLITHPRLPPGYPD